MFGFRSSNRTGGYSDTSSWLVLSSSLTNARITSKAGSPSFSSCSFLPSSGCRSQNSTCPYITLLAIRPSLELIKKAKRRNRQTRKRTRNRKKKPVFRRQELNQGLLRFHEELMRSRNVNHYTTPDFLHLSSCSLICVMIVGGKLTN